MASNAVDDTLVITFVGEGSDDVIQAENGVKGLSKRNVSGVSQSELHIELMGVSLDGFSKVIDAGTPDFMLREFQNMAAPSAAISSTLLPGFRRHSRMISSTSAAVCFAHAWDASSLIRE
jgi:hypothetical protein